MLNFLSNRHRVTAQLLLPFLLCVSINSYSDALLSNKPQSNSAVTAEQQDMIVKRLKLARPELHYTDIVKSPVPGLYKIKINGQIAFVSADGAHLVAGDMFAIENSGLVNLQEKDRREAEVAFEPQRAKMIGAVDKDDMIIFSPKGEVKGYVNVFTDIDCGFCRRLHSQMDGYLEKGIEVRYLAFPRAGIHSKGAQKLATAWCAKDKQLSMTHFKEGKSMPIELCDTHPVADHYMLGQDVGVSGTPALVLSSGQLIPGAVSPEYLAKEMGL